MKLSLYRPHSHSLPPHLFKGIPQGRMRCQEIYKYSIYVYRERKEERKRTKKRENYMSTQKLVI